MKNTSILIMDKNHPLNEEDHLTNKAIQFISKVIVVDGDRYNVIKSRHGKPTQNGHVSDLKEEVNI